MGSLSLRKAKEHSGGKTVFGGRKTDLPRPFPLADDFGVLSGLADFATKIAQQVFIKKDALAGVDGDARIARCRGACLMIEKGGTPRPEWPRYCQMLCTGSSAHPGEY